MVKKNEIKRSYFLNLFSGNAEITDNINDTNLSSAIITNYTDLVGGSGYTESPLISVNGGCPNFAATTALSATSVSSTNYIINNGGSGYASSDTLTLSYSGTGGGSGVVATVNITSGIITGYSALVAGSGYTNAVNISATGGGTGFAGYVVLANTNISNVFTIVAGGTGYLTGDQIIFDNTGTGGSGAVASVIATAGVITGITLSSAGSGYNIKPPTIAVISANGKGANITCSFVATTVSSIVITSKGSGYTTTPAFVFTPVGAGTGVSASPTITNGVITSLTFTNQGSGFTIQAPIVTSVSSTGGTGANITLTLTPTSVNSITITNGGTGFASTPLSFVFTSSNGAGSGASATPITRATKNKIFKWNIRDLQLGRVAEIALLQIVHTNAANNTGYAIRCIETFADGFDSYNNTSAILYLGMGLNNPSFTTYHKLLSQNLNTITLFCTDDLTSSSKIYAGINKNITFSVVLEVVDYVDENQTY